jgi:hypothetical protein
VDQYTPEELDKQRKRAAKHNETVKRGQRADARAAAEIGPPPITKAQRAKGTRLRNKCRGNLVLFNSLVFPTSTGLKPFGKVQLDSISHDQSVIVSGGRVVKAEPRAFGKTTRTGNAALWGVCYGYRRMVPVFCANMTKSKELMDRWKTEILSNDFLLWMFPELIWPLRALAGKGVRCTSQTMNGVVTSRVGRRTCTIRSRRRSMLSDSTFSARTQSGGNSARALPRPDYTSFARYPWEENGSPEV